MATFSVNLSVDEWECLGSGIAQKMDDIKQRHDDLIELEKDDEDYDENDEKYKFQNDEEYIKLKRINAKIDKHQRAKVNQENNITRKNKLIKLYEVEIEKLKEQIGKTKDWEAIAKNKTEALKECFPEYNPAFQGGNDKETIISMITKLKERISITTATASTHIQDINDIHTDYRVKLEDLQKGNDILMKECKRRTRGWRKNKETDVKYINEINKLIIRIKTINEGNYDDTNFDRMMDEREDLITKCFKKVSDEGIKLEYWSGGIPQEIVDDDESSEGEEVVIPSAEKVKKVIHPKEMNSKINRSRKVKTQK